jgi:lipopolysaccharide export system permease protein
LGGYDERFMGNRLLTSYIRREMTGPFVLALVVFLFVLFANRMLQLLQMVFSKGATLQYVASLLLTMMPSFLVYAIPMAFILSLLLAYGRMSADSELVAMRSSGMSLWALTRPAVGMGVFLGLLCMILSIWAVPWGRNQFAIELYRLASNQINVGLRESVFNPLGKDIILYADRVDKGELTGVMLSDNRQAVEPYQVFAEKGVLNTQEGSPILDLELENGRILGGSPVSDTARVVDFEKIQLHIDLREGIKGRNYVLFSEMSIAQLREDYRLRREKNASVIPVLLEIHKKFTLPVGCMIFPFLGIPLAMTNRRSGKTQGFVAALVIIAGYYMVLTMGQNAVRREQLPVPVGMWLANAVLALVASWYYVRTALARPLIPWGRE